MEGVASAATTPSSTPTCLTKSTSSASITISGNRATAHFTLPANCKGQVVSLVSYTAPNGTDHKPFAEQKLFKATTRTFNVSGDRNMSVEVPDCFFQVDLARGQPIQSFAGGVTYNSQGRLLTASGGGSKSCDQPATVQPAKTQPIVQQKNVTVVNNNEDMDMEDRNNNNNQKKGGRGRASASSSCCARK